MRACSNANFILHPPVDKDFDCTTPRNRALRDRASYTMRPCSSTLTRKIKLFQIFSGQALPPSIRRIRTFNRSTRSAHPFTLSSADCTKRPYFLITILSSPNRSRMSSFFTHTPEKTESLPPYGLYVAVRSVFDSIRPLINSMHRHPPTIDDHNFLYALL